MVSLIKKGRDLLIKFPLLIGIASVIFNKTIGFNRLRVRGSNNKVSGLSSSFLRKTTIQIEGNNNSITIQKMSYLNKCKIAIYGNNNEIVIGDNVYVLQGNFYIEDDNNVINIGDSTTISGSTHIAVTEGKKAVIGNDCLFSSEVTIRTGDSHSIIDLEGHRINPASDVIIGDHVWIGNKVIILKGSQVQSNSIVGTGAILTKAIDTENVIIAGNPANIIKRNIKWSKKKI